MPKYVVSSTITHATWNNTTVLSGDVRKEIVKLKRRIDGDIVVHGSAQLAQALLKDDLVDELRLMIFPIVLCTGKRAVRRYDRQEADAARRVANGRRRHQHPHPPAHRVTDRRYSAVSATELAGFTGDVIVPYDARYDQARTLWNAMIDNGPPSSPAAGPRRTSWPLWPMPGGRG